MIQTDIKVDDRFMNAIPGDSAAFYIDLYGRVFISTLRRMGARATWPIDRWLPTE